MNASTAAAHHTPRIIAYPRPRWELLMDQELEFVHKYCDFDTAEDRKLLLGRNALSIWKFPNAA